MARQKIGRFKSPQGAKRYLISQNIRRLVQAAQQTPDEDAYQAIGRIYTSAIDPLAADELERHRDPASHVAAIWRAPQDESADPLEDNAQRCWHSLRWIVEAWYADGLLAANPTHADEDAEEIINPDPTKSSHIYSLNAYRSILVDVYDRLQDLLTDDEPGPRYDRVWHVFRATTHPLVLRVPRAERTLSEIWSDHHQDEDTEITRQRRIDSLRPILLACGRSSLLGFPTTYRDEAAAEYLLESVPDEPEWLEEAQA